MLRILYIEAGSGSGGSSASLKRLLAALDRDKIQPHVLVQQRGTFIQELEGLGTPIEVLRVRGGALQRKQGLWRNLLTHHAPLFSQIRRRILEFRPHLVHLNNSPRAVPSAVLAARSCGVPVVCHLRVARPLNALERYLLKWIDHLIVLSSISLRGCLEQGVSASKISRIPNGIDVRNFWNGSRPGSVRTHLGIPERHPTIGVISRLIPGKGHVPFLRAVRLVSDRRPDVRVVIVGDECEGSSSYPQQLRQLVCQLGLKEIVQLTGWSRNTREMYGAFDLVVQTSLLPEGFPGVILEAMACHLPVVSTAVGGTCDLVEEGRTGHRVPPGNVEAMANAILRLLDCPALMHSMGEAGYQKALEQFDIRGTAEEIEKIYRALVRCTP